MQIWRGPATVSEGASLRQPLGPPAGEGEAAGASPDPLVIRSSPMRSAYSRRKRAPMAWKVPDQIRPELALMPDARLRMRSARRSISARCRTSPSSDIVDGSADRRAIASASSPEHFISTVRRRQRRASTSVVRSSPNVGPCSRGSSSDGLPSAVNMSARRVVAMTAIIRNACGGRQGVNDTRTHG